MIVSGSNDHTIKIWDVKTGKVIKTLKGHMYSVESVAWSYNGLMIVSGSLDNTVNIWDVKSGNIIHALEEHTDSVTSVAWSHDS